MTLGTSDPSLVQIGQCVLELLSGRTDGHREVNKWLRHLITSQGYVTQSKKLCYISCDLIVSEFYSESAPNNVYYCAHVPLFYYDINYFVYSNQTY